MIEALYSLALIGTLYRKIRGGSYPVRAAIHPLFLKIRLINHNYNSGTVRGKSFNIIFVQISEEPTNTVQYYAQGEGKTELVETNLTQCQNIPMDIIEHAPHDGANLYTSLGVFTSHFPRENPKKLL